MEAVPRLPMISFYLKVSPEPTTFGPKLKQVRFVYNLNYTTFLDTSVLTVIYKIFI